MIHVFDEAFSLLTIIMPVVTKAIFFLWSLNIFFLVTAKLNIQTALLFTQNTFFTFFSFP